MANATRTRENIYLIGTTKEDITGCKLPTNKQVMQSLFHSLRKENTNIQSSANVVISKVETFWKKAKIPTRRTQKNVEKLVTLYNEWVKLHKGYKREIPSQAEYEAVFLKKLDCLFDIAHKDALTLITIEEDRKFLIDQRTERKGTMASLDKNLAQKEIRIELRRLHEKDRQIQEIKDQELRDQKVTLSSESSESSCDETNATQDDQPLPPKRPKRAQKQFISPELVATFDRCKISDRNAVRLLTATVQALGLDSDEYVINRSSIQRCRRKSRGDQFEKIRESFQNTHRNAFVLHWDGKLLPSLDSTNKKKIERLPVLVSFEGGEQLLGVPATKSSTGREQANVIFELLEDWGITDKIQALCSDTTSSNTGRLSGACILLEQKLDRELLYFPCRHHIFEVVLRAVFEEKLEKTIGPDVQIFKKFQSDWNQIEKDEFCPGIEDCHVKAVINEEESARIIAFCVKQLTDYQPREDYSEFLHLTIMFLGGDKKMIRAPGAIHHARWMAKALYCLKIFIYKQQFELSADEENGIRDVCIFLVRVYIKYWTQATVAIKAPRLDFQFLQDLTAYEQIDSSISKIAINKMSNHLWYLSPENVALSFFDDDISIEKKREMVTALENTQTDELFKRIPLPKHLLGIDQFISSATLNFFERLGIYTNFIQKDPEEWQTDADYIFGKEILSQMSVVNDTAERGVKLITDYNKILTTDEEQKQYLLQIVAKHRKDYPDVKRSTLRGG